MSGDLRADAAARRGTFVPFYLELLKVPTMTRTDVALFGELERFEKMGECRPAVATIASDLALDVADVRRRFRKLEQLGLIRRHQRAGQPSLIELLWRPGLNEPRSEPPRLKSPRGKSAQAVSAQAPQAVSAQAPQAVSAYQEEEQETEDKKKGTRSAPGPVSSGALQTFDDVLRAEAFARNITPPKAPHGQLRDAAERARDLATKSGTTFEAAARELIRAGLDRARESGRPLGLVLLDVQPGEGARGVRQRGPARVSPEWDDELEVAQ